MASSSQPSSKTNWPELVGKSAQEAKSIIEKESQGNVTTIQIIPKDSMVTMDYREDRVRIFEDENHIVVNPPMIG